MLRITQVVKHLLIINVVLYFIARLIFPALGNYLALYYPALPEFQPYQIVTHMFMHGGTTHLFFNMFALFMFGPPLESLWGAKRFLFYYFFTGFGALALYLFVNYLEIKYTGGSPGAVWGASGAIFGLLIGFGLNFPNQELRLIFPPIPMKAKYFVAFYAALELFLGLGNFNTGIAHFAHLGGALFGLLLILYWRKHGSRI